MLRFRVETAVAGVTDPPPQDSIDNLWVTVVSINSLENIASLSIMVGAINKLWITVD